MNFATWSLRNPIPAVLLFMLLTLAGLYGFRQLPIQALPDMDLPSVNVTLSQPGAAPAQLETEVARKVEDSIATLSGLRHTRTTITDGQVHIQAEFALEKPLSDALIETKDAVDRVRSDLPTDLLQPAVSAQTVSSSPILTYSVSSETMDEVALSWFVDDTLSKTLFNVPGVGGVKRLGGVQREIRVDVDPAQMNAMGVTAADVSRALRRTQQDSSGGRGQLGGEEQSLRTVATVRRADELRAMPVILATGSKVRLDQVASVHDTAAERNQAALLDGKPVIGFSIQRTKGFDETRIAEGVAEALQQLQAEHTSLRITPISGSVAYTLEQFQGSMAMLYEGALLAVLVVWLFLRDWRATLVAASALPLSILPAFAAMWWLGYSLNTLTLLALAVVVGILVDDAIVEVENIERHRRMGKPIMQATADAVNEIALAVIATTATLVVVFVPTTLMGGVPGLFFKQFGWTAVIAVLASLMVARLITPIMAAKLLKPGTHAANEQDGPLMRRYLRVVDWSLHHRGKTMAAAAAFFVGSMALLPFIPTGLVPPSDRGFTTVTLELAPGSALNDTVATAERVRAVVSQLPGVRSVFTTVGAAESGSDAQVSDVRKGELTLVLTDRKERAVQSEIEQTVRDALEKIPGARFTVGGGSGEQLQMILASDNAGALRTAVDAFTRELRAAGLSGVRSTASLERPEIVVRPDLNRAAEHGVSSAAIGELMRTATSGDFDSQLSKLNLDNRQIGIRVRVPDSVRQDIAALSGLRVASRDGLVPLSSVAAFAVESGPAQIDRYDRQRYVTVTADLGTRSLGETLAIANALPSVQNMAPGVSLMQAGDAEVAAELSSGLALAIVTGILCMFCVLILLFKDFFQPITILSAIPLSLGGAFIALLLVGSELDVPSMIGLVMLMGIVTKNSILLVEYAVLARTEHGLSVIDALLDACHKRARPIVMTTVAMIAGMLPIALGFGADASFRQPMAIAVIGGLITSTLLSLVIVPAVFSYVHDFETWLARRFTNPRSPSDLADGAANGSTPSGTSFPQGGHP
ncbi:efflux RND transporter permease subunit [Pseudothauera nasutitermitis]|uniref:Efflux RND transporter permease subunit n=1 Tax=Pseudothauera nasutitermitis TaxID=2565930 RepID=A0A4S4B1X7_9RHOO|nr:efflux RND transporter permease subunit [Pseudothauera nasutitermitis]THF64898.1 efflux RND transporter permease subunit [Pseudothauera nasutitermitis]